MDVHAESTTGVPAQHGEGGVAVSVFSPTHLVQPCVLGPAATRAQGGGLGSAAGCTPAGTGLTLYLGIGEHLSGLGRVGIDAEHAVVLRPAEDELGPERELVCLRRGVGLEAGVSGASAASQPAGGEAQ